MARPSKYTTKLLEEICQRLSQGEPLAQVCRDDSMPCPNTVRDWAEKDVTISALIARARLDGFDAIAAQTRETARGLGESTADVQRDKLIIETDLKLLAKWDPKRYGDRTIIAGDAAAPLEIRDASQIEARLAELKERYEHALH